MDNFIKKIFKDIIENKNYDELLINNYFHEDYIQIVDGKILNFVDFKKHLQKLKNKIKKQTVNFENIISNEKYIFTKHIVESTLNNGDVVKHKVFAEFEVKNGKIINCDELTYLIYGTKDEEKLGSEI